MSVAVEKLRILHYPDASLRKKAKPVKVIDEQVRAVAARMIDLMREAEGVGLAAPQVGLPWRLFVTADPADDGQTRAYLNPKLTAASGSELLPREEGCLSLPGIHVEVMRPSQVTMTATDLDGKEIALSSDGFTARIWQHETDHLDGVLIIDRIKPLDRLVTRKALKELEATAKSTAKTSVGGAGNGALR